MASRRPLQFDEPVLVRIPFTGNGTRYNRGDTLDWKALGVTEERLQVMFDNGYVYQDDPDRELTPDELLAKDFGHMSIREVQNIARQEGVHVTNSKAKQIEIILQGRKLRAVEDDVLALRDAGKISDEDVSIEIEARKALILAQEETE